ncbi:MAG: hypothetical protein Q9159_006339 [Coniocarpon cinnabarinum]
MTTPPHQHSKPLRLLLLHGYTQSGPLFRIKTRALEKTLHKHLRTAFPAQFSGLDFVYPTGPIRIRAADFPAHLNTAGTDERGKDEGAGMKKDGGKEDGDGREEPEAYGWWIRRGSSEPFTYEGIYEGLDGVALELRKAAREGMLFDGIVGFSQGGSLAAMVASLLEPGRRGSFDRLREKGGMEWPSSFDETAGLSIEDEVAGLGQNQSHNSGGKQEERGRGGKYGNGCIHPSFKFCISYSGFGATTNPLYTPFYEPSIKTPILHFLGSVDTIVEEERSMRLVRSCADNGKGAVGKDGRRRERVIRHPGGHIVPTASNYVGFVAEFVGECLRFEDRLKGEGSGKEEKVEEMDVPF